MEQRIKMIMASVFNCEVSDINDNASQDSVELWDSLRHMNLVVALEEEFGVVFTDDETVELLNYKLICEILKSKIPAQKVN